MPELGNQLQYVSIFPLIIKYRADTAQNARYFSDELIDLRKSAVTFMSIGIGCGMQLYHLLRLLLQ